jgi:hypothetical protein
MRHNQKKQIDFKERIHNKIQEASKRGSAEVELFNRLGPFAQPVQVYKVYHSDTLGKKAPFRLPAFADYVVSLKLSLFFLAPSIRIRIP